jgi:hypothetical protein
MGSALSILHSALEVQHTFCKFTATVTAILFPAVPSRNEP